MPTLYSQPSLSGTMPNAFPQYQTLGNGFTDRIFVLGHGPNAMPINDPYQVVDIKEAVNKLGADETCPLMRGLMETYYGGARDIFLVSVAPMSEYQPDITLRDHAWYQSYANELQVTYDMLLGWDIVQIVVPLNAPYFDAHGVDFLTPLVNHCARAFDQRDSIQNSPNTGNIRVGLIGTSFVDLREQNIASSMANDPRLNSLSANDGKFVSIIVGEGVINIPEMPTPYTASLHTSAAAELSQLPYNRSLTYTKLRNNMSLRTIFSKTEIDMMSEAKLNVVDLTSLGKRGFPYASVILTDNTLGVTGTDFWSLTSIRLVMHVIEMTRALGRRYMGSVGLGQFKQDLQSYLLTLVKSDYIRGANCTVTRDLVDPTLINVDITITSYSNIRQINFSISVGPAN